MEHKDRISARIPDYLRKKIEKEANARGLNITDVLMEKIELGYETEIILRRFEELDNEIKRFCDIQKKDLEKFKADILPDIRRIQNISFWILTTLSEFMKISVGHDAFYTIKERVEIKFEDFNKNKKIIL